MPYCPTTIQGSRSELQKRVEALRGNDYANFGVLAVNSLFAEGAMLPQPLMVSVFAMSIDQIR